MRRFLLVACLALVFAAPARAGLNLWTAGGPFGGTVEELAFDPGDPGTVYAGTFGGVYRSEDHGVTWTAANFGLTDAYIVDLEVVPGSPGNLYVATDAGVQKSDDGGRTWQSPSLVQFVDALVLAPSNPQTLYAAVRRATYKSTNGGASWTPGATLPGTDDITFMTADPLVPSHVYAGTSKGLYFSQDAGGTFAPLPAPQVQYLIGLAIDPANTQILYASTWEGVFKSADRGQTWAQSGLAGQYTHAVVIDPASPSTLIALGNEVFRSTNGGVSWTPVFSGHVVTFSAAIDPSSPSTYLLGTSEGIHRSPNGGVSWLASSTGLAATIAGQVAVDPHRPGALYTLVQGNLHKSADAGATWSRINGLPAVHSFALDPRTPSLLYAATGTGLFRSQNGGNTWVLINPSEAGGRLTIDPQTPSTLYLSRFPEGIRKSLNGGITWSAATPDVPEFSADVLAIAPSAPQILFASDFDLGLYKSTDGGATWTLLDIDGLEESSLNALAIDPMDPDVLYAGVQNARIYKSTDGGATWFSSASGIPFANVDGIVIDPFQPSRLYATNLSRGIFRSTNAGATWQTFNDGRLPGLWMEQIVLDPVNPHLLYASSAGGGVLSRAELQPGDSLQLNGNRFRVKMGWATGQGNAGPGFTKPLTGDTGYAWFFQESNVEVLLKVLDACGFNGHFWVFAAGLTNVRTDITVADSQTGAVKLYHSPTGQAFQPIQDTSALSCGTGTAFVASKELSTAAAEPVLLKGGRFRVTAEFVTAPGATPLPTQGALLTDDTGYLWFFNQSNVEVLLKVVDGCALNDRFWIFAAGLTDVEMRITVEDTKTGASKVYENTRGTAFRPVQDTSAFEGCD